MQRKSSSSSGGGGENRNFKRRRWGSSNTAATDASSGHAKDNDKHQRRGKDLAEKTAGTNSGYGYPSSDSDNDTRNLNRGAKTPSSGRARKERRMQIRSFRGSDNGGDASAKDDRNKSLGETNGRDTLPTPGGWAQISKKDDQTNDNANDDNGANAAGHRPLTDISRSSGFTLSSAPKNAINPYTTSQRKSSSNHTNNYTTTPASRATNAKSSAPPTTTTSKSRSTKPRTTHHVVCAVSENLARETCVASIDAGRPTYLHITKQGNGQTYAETMALLRMLNPDEVLLNEGRKNSQLAVKVAALFGQDMAGMDNLVTANCTKNMIGKRGVGGTTKNNQNNRGRSRFSNNKSNGRDQDDDLTTADALSSACETSTVVKFVPRSYFDQTKGAELLRKLAREDTYDSTLVEEYILLSSSYAVLQYAQLCLGAGLSRGSLALDINVGGNHRMNIDRSTMTNLELLVNAKTGKTANSLVGTIDCTKTSVGGRLLRTNMMAPPTRLDTINARLDLVDELLADEEFFYVIMEHLEDLPDVDKMLSYVALNPRKNRDNNGNAALFGNTERQTVTARIASKGISALVCIKSTLSSIPSFANVLEVQLKEMDQRENLSSVAHGKCSSNQKQRKKQDDEDNDSMTEEGDDSESDDSSSDSMSDGPDKTTFTNGSSLQIGLGTSSTNNKATPTPKRTRHQLLRAILIAMKQPALSHVLNAVTEIFTESTSYSKNSHAMRHQECFALKPNTDGMMDVLRKAFLANVDDIYRLADEYSETYDINVQVRETTSRGYYLSVSADLGSDLPQIFIQPVKNGKFINCTTEEVYSLTSRAQENVQDLLLMTHERIQEVLEVARAHYDCLASLSDAIALLDMCHCFADNVASSRLPWCRPVLSDRDGHAHQEDGTLGGAGAIAIRNGRYAIDVSSNGVSSSLHGGDFVPNDTYSSALQNFTVITGINGSGKSTYLKQIAIIAILAHCGSYVPAEEALLPIRDQICTRIGTADDQEHNISTFLLEMKETAFICNSTTDRSLFLLDELGRATSNEDGVAVAWAVSEFLLTKRAMTFFVTHYPQISKLAAVYTNVQNQHLGSQITSGDINYTHKIMPGPCKSAGDYGVEMTVSCGWPADVVENARKVRLEVQKKMPGADLCEGQNVRRDESFAENRRNAHNILCDLAKNLMAVKEGEGRLSKEAKRNYLQGLRDRLVPTSDQSLVRMIRNLLLNVQDADMPMIPLISSRQQQRTTARDPIESQKTLEPPVSCNAPTKRSIVTTQTIRQESAADEESKELEVSTSLNFSFGGSSSSSSDESTSSCAEDCSANSRRNSLERPDAAPLLDYGESCEGMSAALPDLKSPGNHALVGNIAHPKMHQDKCIGQSEKSKDAEINKNCFRSESQHYTNSVDSEMSKEKSPTSKSNTSSTSSSSSDGSSSSSSGSSSDEDCSSVSSSSSSSTCSSKDAV